MKLQRQHDQSEVTEHSERKGTSALSPAQRTKSRTVRTTGPDVTHKSTAKTAEDRRNERNRANSVTPSEGVGLAAAAKSGNRNAEGVKAQDLGV
jgi:hypothetical protein